MTAIQRGFCLEAVLTDLLESQRMEPRASYRPAGEQVDGSFRFESRFFLLEAKWVQDPVPASNIYAFKGKVDGKLLGTLGLMIAMNGYSEDSVAALTAGKELSVLLADGEDLRAAVSDAGSFSGMLRFKVRAAVDEGAVFAPYRITVDGARTAVAGDSSGEARIQFAVEGRSDATIVGRLGRRVLDTAGSPQEIETFPAYGLENAIRLAGALRDAVSPEALVGVIVDADGEGAEERQRRFGEHPAVRGRQIVVTVATPGLAEEWLQMDTTRRRGPKWQDAVDDAVEVADVDELRARSASFERFASALERHVAGRASPAPAPEPTHTRERYTH